MIAGDPVKIEKKYQDPITIEPTAKHLFAANTLPAADIDDDAFFGRTLLVSFPNTIPRDERDPHLVDELLTELPGVLNWALDGLARLREQGHFSGELPPEETQEKWRAWGESIKQFKQRCVDDSAAATDAVPKGELFDAYRQFCEVENVPDESWTKFGREIKDDPQVGEARRTIDGERVWVYTGIDLVEDRVPTSGGRNDEQGGFHDF